MTKLTDWHILVGTVGQGVWRSDDGGLTWRRTSRGMFVECDVRALAAHPQDRGVLYAGTNEGCYLTKNFGDSWQLLGEDWNGLVIWSLLILPDRPEIMFAGLRPAGLLRSGDGGKSWQHVDVAMNQDCPGIMHNRVTTLVADPVTPGRLWAGVEIDGVWKSDDAGLSWDRRAQGLSSLDIHGLAVIPSSDKQSEANVKLVASTDNDLNVSTDLGMTWSPQQIGQVFGWPYCRGLAQRPGSPEVLYQGNGTGPPGDAGALWRSTDGGNSWQQRSLPAVANSTVWGFCTHPSNPGLVFAYTVSGQVFASLDGGESWNVLPRVFGEIRALLVVPKQ